MKYNYVNSALALLEYVFLHEQRDQFIDFEFLTKEIIERLEPLVGDTSKIEEYIVLGSQVTKSEEFRNLIRSEEFQQIYERTLTLQPYFLGGADSLCRDDYWDFLNKAKSYKDLINSESVNQLKLYRGKFTSDEFMLLCALIRGDLPQILFRSIRYDLIPNDYELLPLPKIGKNNTVLFSYYNKVFEFREAQITVKRTRAILEKYLIDSCDKENLIKESIECLNEAKTILFYSDEEDARFYYFYFITTYILEFECLILNNYSYQKSQNSMLYKLIMAEDPLFKLDHNLLFFTIFSAGLKGSMKFVQNDFNDFWHDYATLISEMRKAEIEEKKKEELEVTVKKIGNLYGLETGTNNSLRVKKKLPCYNYLFAALLHEKARGAGDDFVRLCRDAAEMYVDRNGKEFTGEQLANVFHITVKKYGGWPGFYEKNKEQLRKLKKEINWQE